MNKNSWLIFGVVMALLTASAVFLVSAQARQKLGQPGVRVVAKTINDEDGKPIGTQSVALPEQISGYESSPVPITRLELDWLPKDTVFGRRSYLGSDGFGALLSIVLMGRDRTSIHKPEYCLPGSGWKIIKKEEAAVPIAKPRPYNLKVNKWTVLGQSSQGRAEGGVYVFWFVSEDEQTPHHQKFMWSIMKKLVATGILQRWAYVTYFATCRPGQEEAAFSRMKELIAASVPEFQLTAGETGGTISSLP